MCDSVERFNWCESRFRLPSGVVMEKLKPFLFGALVGAGLAVCALQFHVVHSHEGVRVVARTPQPSLGLSYADVRGWDAKTWAERPELVRALVANGSGELVADTVADNLTSPVDTGSDTLDQLRGLLDNADSELSNRNREQPQPLERDWGEESSEDFLGSPFTEDAPPFPSASRDEARRTRVAARDLNSLDDGTQGHSSSYGSAYTRQSDSSSTSETSNSQGDGSDSGTDYSDSGYNSSRSSSGSSYGSDSGTDYSDSGYNSNRSSSGSSHGSDSGTDYSGSGYNSNRSSSGSSYGPESDTDSFDSGYDLNTNSSDSSGSSDQKLFGNDDTGEQYGVFEDVTDELESRAEKALSRARESLGSNEFLGDSGSYLRPNSDEDDSTSSSTRPSFDDAPAFSRGRNTNSRSAINQYMPEFLRAIEEGFDPFANGDVE